MSPPTSKLALVLLLAAALAACATSFTRHTLYLPAEEATATLHGDIPAVRVSLPHYVDTRSLLWRARDGTLNRFEAHEWAELPADGYTRLLRESLGHRQLAVREGLLRVEFTRFEVDGDGIFRARGTWRLRDGRGEEHAGTLVMDRRLPAVTPRHLVAAMSESVRHTADAVQDALSDATSPGTSTQTATD